MSLLCRRFRKEGIEKQPTLVLEDICAVVHKNFRYLHWDEERDCYLRYPGTGTRFDMIERD